MNLTKNTGKPHVISYTRNDGTKTWMHASDYFVRHDLSHYALETILQYQTAFNGMLNNGMDVKDFEDREKRLQIDLTAEACYAENMANLFLTEIAEGSFEDFNKVQQQAFLSSFGSKYPLTVVPYEKIEAIRFRLQGLLQEWTALPAGETLTLTFGL